MPVLAVHRTILAVDVEGFGDRRRTNPHQVAVREGLYRVLRQAFRAATIPWSECHHEDRGDGVLILARPEVAKSVFVESLPAQLVEGLREHNSIHPTEEQIRLRMALHAGELHYDDHGVTGASINLTFRLLDASPLRSALAESPGVLALITSSWFFDEVVRHSPSAGPTAYRPVRVRVKETNTVGWIHLPDHPYPPRDIALSDPLADLTAPVPHQLSADTAHFVGRTEELRQLSKLVDTVTEDGATVVISAVSGTAGVGKTALALRWAHRVRGEFPDGQLYVNLRGYDPNRPLSPGYALAGFLRALGVAGAGIPPELDERAGLYRSLLDGRRILIVLDNASSVEQVRPLLPGTPSALVVVTSRDSLAGLVAHHGATRVDLDLLPLGDAIALLGVLIGKRVGAEPDAAAVLAGQCARLPLALRVAAELAVTRPTTPLAGLVEELADEQRRLELFDAGGDPRTAIRAVFSWSYQNLPAEAARAFRLLGLHPGPDLDPYAAAALIHVSVKQAQHFLDLLARGYLVQPASFGRYGMHDLLRAYATRLTIDGDSEEEQCAALTRLFDHYLATAAAAMDTLVPAEQHRRPRIPPTATLSPPVTDSAAARAWLDAERATLTTVCAHAAAHDGWPEHTTRLASILFVLLEELESLQEREVAESRAEQDPGGVLSSMAALLRRRTSGKTVVLAAIVALLVLAAGSFELPSGFIGDPSEAVSAGTLELSIPVGVEPLGIEEGEDFVWTSNSGGTVSRINPRDGTVVHIDVGGQPKNLKIGNGAVWVWNYLDAVTRVDIVTGEVSAPLRSAAGPISGIAFGDGYLWLTHGPEGSVSRISATSNRSEDPPIKVGARLGGTTFGNRRLYVVDVDARALIAVDGTTGRVLNDPLRLDHALGGLQVYDGVIYVGSTDGVTPVDETTFVVGDLIPLKDAGLFEVGGGSLWASYPLENVLRRFDLTTSAQQGDSIKEVGKGLGQTLFTAGLLWATEPSKDTVVRVRPAEI